MPAATKPTVKPAGKGKSMPIDPEEALGAAGWFLKRVAAELDERMTRLEKTVQEQRRPKR
jgi:hypothetical protein